MSRKSSQPIISKFFSAAPLVAVKKEKQVVADTIDLTEDVEDTPQPEANPESKSLAGFKFNKSVVPVSTVEQKLKRESFKSVLLEGNKRKSEAVEPSQRRKSLKSHFDQLTPLEQQYVNLKRKNLDKVLAIQVGYKFKFFGEDAQKVHKILSIMLIPGKISLNLDDPKEMEYDKFAYCSIPENRLHIHIKRLLNRGMKVGVVEQIEVAAIKSQSSNKNSLFERKITRIYTSGTYIEDDSFDSVFSKSGNFIIALKELETSMSIIAVQISSGEVIYDSFEDDLLRNELETRLLHLDPTEFVIIDEISKESRASIENFKNSKNSNLRITEVKSISHQTYLNEYSAFFDDYDFITSLPTNVQIACFEMINYLKEFSLESILNRTEYYESFSTKNYMILNSQTLKNLEIFQNSTNGEERGSLMWLLDHTRTKFGCRLLKKWISKPLVNREEVLQRQDCVECSIANYKHRVLELFINFLKSCPDLEKSLNRIHFQRCSMKEIYAILQTINKLLDIVRNYKEEEFADFNDSMRDHFMDLKALSDELIDFESYLEMINSHIINDKWIDPRQQKLQYFNSTFFNFEEMGMQKSAMNDVRGEIEAELVNIRKLLKRPQLQYTKNNKEEYLIEVRNSEVGKLPLNWVKFNSNRSVSRFFTPEVLKLLDKFKYHEELLLNETELNFKKFLARIDSHYSPLNKMVKSLAKLDCILSLASVSVDLKKPTLVDKPFIELVESKNPILEMLNPSRPTIANDIKMSVNDGRVLIITGPNMGGKSSLIKQIAITVIMTQIGCFIPVRQGCLGIFTQIFIRMGSSDNIFKGESSFQLELTECLNILKQRDDRSLILLDEIGRGTSTNDGYAIAYSLLNYMITETNSFILFITHFNRLINFEKRFDVVKNYHMDYLISGRDLTFLYKFIRGGCSKSYGINVARLTSIPDEVIDDAKRISKEYEASLGLKMDLSWTMRTRDIIKLMKDGEAVNVLDTLEDLVDNI